MNLLYYNISVVFIRDAFYEHIGRYGTYSNIGRNSGIGRERIA